jgi:Divergent InlB B-repeat domain
MNRKEGRLSQQIFLIFLLLLVVMILQGEAIAAQLSLTWKDNSTNEDGFDVERKTGTGGTFALIKTVGANVVSYTDSSLAAGTTYCYRVRSYNAVGDSTYSNQACGTTTSSQTFTLTVTKTGSGTVLSTPAGINCGSDCSESSTKGKAVTLTATPATSSTFTGWSGGGCSGTGVCTIIANANISVTATFSSSGSR